ncbi:hypothetical protein MXB_69 [Myxobolus squamalis]|nr:hypothetical protein MXB_69 [Myxobolus squamalis]
MRRCIQRLFSARGIKTINEFKFSHYKKGGIPLFRIPTGYPLEALKKMIELNIFERVMTEAQKRGRINFFITSTGEEATTIGCAAALNQEDWIFSQYREAGSAYLWRGFSTEQMINQIMGNINDPTKGRQMPMHFGDSMLKIFMNSSTIASQMPQAVGCAFSFKFQNLSSIVAAFLGDGANSEGDSQVSYNMAQTLKCPVLFLW